MNLRIIDVEIVLASAEETVTMFKRTLLRNCTDSSAVVLLPMSPTQWKLALEKGCVKRFIMAINNGKGNIILSCDHVTAYLSISFVERESRSQKDQKRRSEVHTEGLPCFDLSSKKLGIIIYILN